LREYVDLTVSDIDNMHNLTAVYNRCEMYDSALAIYSRILEQEPENTEALVGSGRYYNQMAKFAMDSSRHYREAGDEAAQQTWVDKRDEHFDTAKVYFAKAFELSPDSAFVAEEYAILCYITEDYETAITPFMKLTELQPENPDHWTSLGDCYLKTQQWDKAARAYEKVVEINPDNIPIWESLEALYKQLGETDNLKKAQEKLKG
jgi:tetratricopeptide (TPR) repeat protein